MYLRIATLLFALHCLLTGCNANDCRRMPGALMQIDAYDGKVVGAALDNTIWKLEGSSWTRLPGRLKHISVGPAGLWGVNSGKRIYKWGSTNWVQVSGALEQIDAGGDGFVSGANHHDTPYCGVTKPNRVNWVRLDGKLKYYSCGPYSCWGVNKQDRIYVRKGVTSTLCQGDGWQHIEGSLSMIEVADDGSVYGVNSVGNVYRRDSTSNCTPEGTGWTKIPIFEGNVKHVSYDSGHLWIILKNDAIYDCPV
ncbi:fish-egg lectin-like [Sardina pilchardus]|uniref:fish-egg lectin-like n=1 Tax=Sardina pilchardus TaxID=27697 RepID=UPI002E15715E